jgi:hypothetical protein
MPRPTRIFPQGFYADEIISIENAEKTPRRRGTLQRFWRWLKGRLRQVRSREQERSFATCDLNCPKPDGF